MSLIKCSECGKEISDKAKACPKCGYPVNEEKERKKGNKVKLVAAKCPNCGSNIEVNQNDNKSKCEYCRATILVDDAIERLRVELSGEVEVKNLPKLKNLLKIADRAFEDEDYSKALENYKQALAIDSDDWRATYREGICAANTSTLGNFDLDKVVLSSKNALKILINNKTDKKELAIYKVEMAHDLVSLCLDFYNFAFNHYEEYSNLEDSANEMWDRLLIVRKAARYSVDVLVNDKIVSLCPKDESGEDSKEWQLLALKEIVMCNSAICEPREYKSGYNQYGDIYSNTTINSNLRTELVNEYDQCVAIIKQTEPDYVPEQINRTGSSGGCYVATCVYGSYDCPQVWTLRRFRDYGLSKSWYGRLFIKTYYAISPTIVKMFGKTKWFNNMWKPRLDKMVKKLNKEGYNSTPYEDKNW